MGFSLTWLAVHGKRSLAVRDELGLDYTEEFDDVPDWPFCEAKVRENSWYLVLANGDARFFDDKLLRSLSAKCEVVACVVEEHVMASGVKRWRDGKQTWSVMHDAESGLDHQDTQGRLPASFRSIRDEIMTQQRRAPDHCDWLFDIPIEVARAETGFRHDRGGVTFERLTSRHERPKRSARSSR